MSKTARIIINFCLTNNIGILVCGYNPEFQLKSGLGRKNNQIFVNIPFGKLREKLKYLCKFYGMKYFEQEESYTSKSSFWDKDKIPEYKPEEKIKHEFFGRRIKRGMYRTSNGKIFNADVNGALNI